MNMMGAFKKCICCGETHLGFCAVIWNMYDKIVPHLEFCGIAAELPKHSIVLGGGLLQETWQFLDNISRFEIEGLYLLYTSIPLAHWRIEVENPGGHMLKQLKKCQKEVRDKWEERPIIMRRAKHGTSQI